MLQEYPTQIQPRSSSTRRESTQDVFESTATCNKVDAEASRILIDLANQDTFSSCSSNIIIDNKFNIKRRKSSKVSLPIKTDANLHLQQERSQPDPIMLLAAAAAVIDDEGKYKGRFYERREIRLHGRLASATVQKRKSFTFGESDHPSSNIVHRRHSERRHQYYGRPLVSADTWLSFHNTSVEGQVEVEEEEEEEKEEEVEKAERNIKGNNENTTHAFSWQYLSMKQNPRIKRNAMHAYITYMIYTDMAHEQQKHQHPQHPHYQQQQQVQSFTMKQEENSNNHHHWYNNNNNKTTTTTTNTTNHMQSYLLPPSPQQRHDPPLPPTTTTTASESIIGRPLTDFLFERNHNMSTQSITMTTNRLPHNPF